MFIVCLKSAEIAHCIVSIGNDDSITTQWILSNGSIEHYSIQPKVDSLV